MRSLTKWLVGAVFIGLVGLFSSGCTGSYYGTRGYVSSGYYGYGSGYPYYGHSYRYPYYRYPYRYYDDVRRHRLERLRKHRYRALRPYRYVPRYRYYDRYHDRRYRAHPRIRDHRRHR